MTGQQVVIFGAGTGAATAHRYFAQDSPHEVCAFTADAPHVTGPSFRGLPLVAFDTVADRYPPDRYRMFVALGFQEMNQLRRAKFDACKAKGYTCVSYLSSRHYALEPLAMGENCFILDSNVFNLDVRVGDNVTIWSANHIGDRTEVGDDVWISSHVTLAGDVRVGAGAFLGTNAAVSNHVRLGARTFVGTGAVVAKDTAEASVHLAAESREIKLASDKFLSILRIS